MNNLGFLHPGKEPEKVEAKSYQGLAEGYKLGSRTTAASPVASQRQIALYPLQPEIKPPQEVAPFSRFKADQRFENDEKERVMREHLRQVSKVNAQDEIDKFTLKFYFKSNPHTIKGLDQKLDSEKGAIANLKKTGNAGMLTQAKNYNLNLQDFGGKEIYQMKDIIDFILRKVSECLLYMQVMNKTVLQSASSADQQKMEKDKQESNFRNYEYKKTMMAQAEAFWDQTISMGVPNLA